MAHELTIDQVTERSHQAEIICRMIESYPDTLADSEIIAIAALLRRLTGDVCAWLIEEQAMIEAKEKKIN